MSNIRKNSNLSHAKKAKNDEFYTQYSDIEKEIQAYLDFDPNTFLNKTVLLPCDDPEWSNFTKYFAQNFSRLGLKKLISTSFAPINKNCQISYQTTLLEENSPLYNKEKSIQKGKIFTLTADKNSDGIIDLDDLEWKYLQGNGDFRSDEIKLLRDEADIIITNPPFSLFREFLSWILEANKKFLILCSMNVISYKDVFPLIAKNKIWLGHKNGSYSFFIPEKRDVKNNYTDNKGNIYAKFGNICWITNLESDLRYKGVSLCKKYNEDDYKKYDNYDAIEVSRVKDIPYDYYGFIGVPITFLCHYNPNQFEILDADFNLAKEIIIDGVKKENPQRFYIEGKRKYARIIIRNKGGL